MYAIIETCGRQYKVSEGMIVLFEKLNVEAGKKITFDKVLLVSDGNDVKVGSPTVANATVEGTVLADGKRKKVLVFKYKAKKNYKRIQGHRQPFTKVKIEKIVM